MSPRHEAFRASTKTHAPKRTPKVRASPVEDGPAIRRVTLVAQDEDGTAEFWAKDTQIEEIPGSVRVSVKGFWRRYPDARVQFVEYQPAESDSA